MFKVIIISCLTTVLIMLVQTGSKKLSNNVNTTCRHRIMTTRPARDTCLSPRLPGHDLNPTSLLRF
jgi:hypothetical protein